MYAIVTKENETQTQNTNYQDRRKIQLLALNLQNIGVFIVTRMASISLTENDRYIQFLIKYYVLSNMYYLRDVIASNLTEAQALGGLVIKDCDGSGQ